MRPLAKGLPLIGWQTLLADLSLILFMVTGAALASGPTGTASATRPDPPAEPAAFIHTEPVAVWRAGSSQTLQLWLNAQQPDPRQQLTITAHYRAGGQPDALAAVQALLRDVGARGAGARVVIEPAARPDEIGLQATLAYDKSPP